MVSSKAMKSQDIQKTLDDAQDAFGSANPSKLGQLVIRLMAIIRFLLAESSRKDEQLSSKGEELAGLRNKVFGSSSEKLPRAGDFQNMGRKTSEDLELDPNPVEEPKASTESEIERIKAMRAEARRLARQLKKKDPESDEAQKIKELRARARELAKAMAQPDEFVRHRVPDDLDIHCPVCGDRPKDAGLCHRVDEIDVLKSLYVKRQHLLHKAVCGCCSLRFVMPGPVRGQEKTNYSPRFIARLIYDKFQNCLPATRQAKDMQIQGLKIHRNSLIRLLINAHMLLAPLANRIREINRAQSYQHCDESPVTTVISGKKAKRWLWCLISEQAVSFEISEKRNKEVARQVIGDTPGVLTSDRLSIYHDLIADKIESGCLAHLRRKFWYALPTFPDEAIHGLRLIGEIYDVEHEASEQKLAAPGRLKLRQEKSVPILTKLKDFAAGLDPPPRSSLAKAVNYLESHWQVLTYFTQDGQVRVDNNIAEAALRLPKLGFKNFLFANSELGCGAVADFYTILATCVKHDVNPLDYLSDVITRLNCNWKNSRLDELLPWNWTRLEVHGPFMVPTRDEDVPAAKVIDLARAKAERCRQKAPA
jgi:transposase